MGKTINHIKQLVYTCGICKMRYHDKETAKKCEEWCSKNKKRIRWRDGERWDKPITKLLEVNKKIK